VRLSISLNRFLETSLRFDLFKTSFIKLSLGECTEYTLDRQLRAVKTAVVHIDIGIQIKFDTTSDFKPSLKVKFCFNLILKLGFKTNPCCHFTFSLLLTELWFKTQFKTKVSSKDKVNSLSMPVNNRVWPTAINYRPI